MQTPACEDWGEQWKETDWDTSLLLFLCKLRLCLEHFLRCLLLLLF